MRAWVPAFLATIFVLTVFLPPAFAQADGNPANWCRNGGFPLETSEFRIARVIGKRGEKVHFSGDDGDCPDGAKCRLKSYLVPGDEVIVSRTLGRWSCSWFQPVKGHETVGWLPSASLKTVAVALPSLASWTGVWNHDENSIEIRAGKSGTVHVIGSAFWKGLGDNIHIGEIDEVVRPDLNSIMIGAGSTGQYDCRATMRLAGKFLIVSDNLQCGGANVSFTGVYRKK